MVEALADAIDDAFFQRTMVDDRRIEESGKEWVLFGSSACFLAHAVPDRVHDLHRAQAFYLANIRYCDHWRSPDFLSGVHYIE